jgi:hypothetical protein
VHGADTTVFKLESEEAPACRVLDSPEDIDTTLVTQLSDNRLWMMRHHCERYGPHPISIAVYSNSTLWELAAELMILGCRVEGKGGLILRPDEGSAGSNDEGAIVSLNVLDARTHGSADEYPVNELRNLALSAVRTSHITYIDVDFWPSSDLYDRITSPNNRQRLLEDPQLALVHPAFQLNRVQGCKDEKKECKEEHVPMMPKTLGQLARGMLDAKITIFDPGNTGGHGSTDYQYFMHHQLEPNDRDGNEWSTATNLLADVPCLKSHRYEPFVTIRYCRELTPPFQMAFSGYGKNKITWLMQVVASGFVFSQLGGAYLVHYPHAISESRKHWNEAPDALHKGRGNWNYNVRKPKKSDGDLNFEAYHRGQVDDMYKRFKNWLRKTYPEEQQRMPMCENANDDDSKLWIAPDRKQNWNSEKT